MTRAKSRSFVLGLLIASVLGLTPGCSALLPSPPTISTSDLSDKAVLDSARAVQDFYVSRSGKAKIVATSGAIGLAGIATAGAGAAQGGASVGVMSLIVTIGNFLGQAIGIFEPTERAIIYDAGASDIQNSIADYMDTTAPATGTKTIPPTGYTKAGAGLMRKLATIQRVTNDMLNHVRPSSADLAALMPKEIPREITPVAKPAPNIKLEDLQVSPKPAVTPATPPVATKGAVQ